MLPIVYEHVLKMSRTVCIMRTVIMNLSFDIPEYHNILKNEFIFTSIKNLTHPIAFAGKVKKQVF